MAAMDAVVPIRPEALQSACSQCNLRELCLPVTLDDGDLAQLDTLVARRRKVSRGETLSHAGAAFESLHAVKVGFFKSCVAAPDGREQVTGFHMTGELMGFDGIGSGTHTCDIVALEDSEVCVIPYAHLEQVAHQVPGLQREFHRILSREIVHDHGVMLLLGSMRAEERLASFLLNITRRLKARGYSGSSVVLRMTRQEIGSYLGMKLETVSRTLSRFQADGLLDVNQRQIEVLDAERLHGLIGTH